jgi:hypothetical protein
MIDIIEGHLKELFNKEEELSEKRLKICKVCPLYKNDSLLGEICNSKLYFNPEINKISNYPRQGYYNGCGCRIQAKSRLINAKCPLNKWNNVK